MGAVARCGFGLRALPDGGRAGGICDLCRDLVSESCLTVAATGIAFAGADGAALVGFGFRALPAGRRTIGERIVLAPYLEKPTAAMREVSNAL